MKPAFFMYQYIVVERADADTRYSVIFFTCEAARPSGSSYRPPDFEGTTTADETRPTRGNYRRETKSPSCPISDDESEKK